MRVVEILVPEQAGKHLTELEDLLRFWMKVDLSQPTGCWKWTGAKFQEGYGQYISGARSWVAHRMAYTDCVGPIPTRKTVRLECGNRLCCNPSHMSLGRDGNARKKPLKSD